MARLFFNVLLVFLWMAVQAQEDVLRDVEQLTSPLNGFKKAGEAYFAPDGAMIVFQGVPLGEEDYQIFTMDLATRATRRISRDAGACTCSFFRPDGAKLIYAASPRCARQAPAGQYKWDLTRYMNIYEANVDGSDAVPLTSGAAYHAECAYSPDGSRIVYASDEDGSMNIYVMDSDGGGVRQLTRTTGCYNGGPFFSPDGSKIVFRADRQTPHRLQIYVMDADGGNVTQLTDDEAVNWAPFWHPSGRAIVYTTSLHGHHNYQIYLMNVATRRRHRITYAPTFNGLATFNDDGTKLLWTSKRGMDNSSQVFIADISIPEAWLADDEHTVCGEDL